MATVNTASATAQATTTQTATTNKVTVVKSHNHLSIIRRESVKNAQCIDVKRALYQAVDTNGELVQAGKKDNGRDKMPFFIFVQGIELQLSSGIITPKTVTAIARFRSIEDAKLTVDNFELIAADAKVHTELQWEPFYEGQTNVQYQENGQLVDSQIDNKIYYRQYTLAPKSYVPKKLTDSQPVEAIEEMEDLD